MPLIFNMLKLRACMEMKSWISLSYTQIWFLALDQQAGSTGSEEAGVWPAPTSDLFKKEETFGYLSSMAAWVLCMKTEKKRKKRRHSGQWKGIPLRVWELIAIPVLEVWGDPIQSLVSTWAGTLQSQALRRVIWAHTAVPIFHPTVSSCSSS